MELNRNTEQQRGKQVGNFIIKPKCLGQGAFGDVFEGYTANEPEKLVAVKTIDVAKLQQKSKDAKSLSREIKILKNIESPYVVKMYDVIRTTNNIYIFLELCRHGDLRKLMEKRKNNRLVETEALFYFRQLIEGYKSLFKKNIVHRDIKPENILLNDGKALISDFNLSRFMNNVDDQLTIVGTPFYMSPQLLDYDVNENRYTNKCDVWSFGIMLYELIYGQRPWAGSNVIEYLKAIKSQPIDYSSVNITQDTKNLINDMLQIKEEDRISWEQLFNHPYVKTTNVSEQVQALIEETQKLDINNEQELEQIANAQENILKKNKVSGLDKSQYTQEYFALQKQNSTQSEMQSSVRTTQTQRTQDITNIDLKNPQLQSEHSQQQEKFYQLKDILQSIDSKFTFERNLSVFLNLTNTMIYKSMKKIKINLIDFYQLVFVMCKRNIQVLKKVIYSVDNNLSEEFDANQINEYKQSKSWNDTQEIIKQDLSALEPFFQQFIKKGNHFFSKIEDKSEIKQFLEYFNEDFLYKIEDEQEFNKIFTKTIINSIKIFYKNIQENVSLQEDKEFLKMFLYLLICANLQTVFKWDGSPEPASQFHEFYSIYDEMSTENQLKEIAIRYKSFSKN